MTTPSRELPPLRVRLIGDGKSFSDMVKQAKKDAESLGKTVKNTLGKAAKAVANAEEKEFLRQFHNHRLLEKSKKIEFDERIRRMKAVDASYKKQLAQDNKAVAQKDRDEEKLHKERLRRMRQLDAAAKRDIAAADRAARRSAGGGSRGGRGGGFSGMGDRADIYMHSGALRTMAGAVGTVMNPMAQLENATVLLEVFSKDAKKAAAIVQDMRAFAIQSPYGMRTLLDSTAMMAKFGINAEQAADMTKRLGEVAAGDAEKMGRLAYALGQVKTAGKLTGYELRQLTEAGFNPLMTIAKQTAKSMSDADIEARYAELEQMKADGLISSKAVIAALKVETSAGGDFAGVMQKLNNTVGGLTNQVIELVEALGVDIFSTLADQIKAALRVTIQYLTAMRKWVAENKEQVKQWANLIKQVFIAVAVFHLLGLAVAYTRWVYASMLMLLTAGRAIWAAVYATILAIRTAFLVLNGTLAITQIGFVATWLAALGPAGLVVAAVAAIIAVVGMLAIYLTSEGGLVGAFRYVFDLAQKFFFWLAEKMGIDIKAGIGFKLEPLPEGPAIPAAEKVDWDALLGKGKGGKASKGDKAVGPAADAAVMGSADHAVRRWEYSQRLRAQKEGAGAANPEQKQLTFLEEIARNTRKEPNEKIMQANFSGATV